MWYGRWAGGSHSLGLVGAKEIGVGRDSGDEEVEQVPESLRGGINRAYGLIDY